MLLLFSSGMNEKGGSRMARWLPLWGCECAYKFVITKRLWLLIYIRSFLSACFNSAIRVLKALQPEAPLLCYGGGDVGMKLCYYINTIALLTPGSYFLRCNPWSFRAQIYSNWPGVDVLLWHFISPLCAPSLPSPFLLPTLHRHPGFSSNFRAGNLTLWHVLGRIFTSTSGTDVHLCDVQRRECSALLKSVNKKELLGKRVRHPKVVKTHLSNFYDISLILALRSGFWITSVQ